MRKRIVLTFTAAAIALPSAASAKATFIFKGSVTEQLSPGVDPLVSLGDEITVRFKFDPAELYTSPYDESYLLIDRLASVREFSIRTSGGLEWRASDEYLDIGVPIRIDGRRLTWSGYFNRPGANDLPDISISATNGSGSFTIQSAFLYGNSTETLGFRGIIAQVSPAPEPATWAMMVGGFGMLGAAMRRRARISVA